MMVGKHISRSVRRLAEILRVLLSVSDLDTSEGRANHRKQRAALTAFTSIVARILSFASIILATRMALADMGSERFGIWSTIASMVALLNFLDFGVGNGLIAPVARHAADGDHDALNNDIALGIGATFWIATFCAALLFFAFQGLNWQLMFRGMASSDVQETGLAIKVFILLLAVSIPLQTVVRIFMGLQRGYIVNSIAIIVSIATCAILFVTEQQRLNIVTYIMVTFGLAQFVGLAGLAILCWERRIDVRILARARFEQYRPLLAVGGPFFGLQIAAMIGWGSDQLLISSLSGPADAGIYAIGVRIFMLVSIPLYTINAPLWASYADALQRGDLNDLKKTLRNSIFGTLAVAFVASGMVVIFGRSIWAVFSGGVVPYDVRLIAALAIWTIIDCTANAVAMFFNGTGMAKNLLFTAVVFILISLPVKLFVISNGAYYYLAIATSICYVIVFSATYYIYLRHNIARLLSSRA
jgi:O-antigen/teichoic acid export membrane protein